MNGAVKCEPGTEEQGIKRELSQDSLEDEDPEKRDDEKKKKEEQHFERVVNAFRFYPDHYLGQCNARYRFIQKMPLNYRERLKKYLAHLENIKNGIQQNACIMKLFIEEVRDMFENVDYNNQNFAMKEVRPTRLDMDKTASVMRQVVREWTKEGAEERRQSFGLIIKDVERYFGLQNPTVETRKNINILVPGAGLGRLSYELAMRGFSTQGNEHSLFMLFPSNFILNCCLGKNYQFYPFVHQVNNVLDSETQLRKLTFPDIIPSNIPEGVNFSMAAGNFVEVYATQEYRNYFDCVCTCFFIDTAPNVLEYLDVLGKTLKPNGIWINLGPLLYHFAEIPGEGSIEPCYDHLKELIDSFGFDFVEEKKDMPCNYTQNSHSMLSYLYKCVYFICRKRE